MNKKIIVQDKLISYSNIIIALILVIALISISVVFVLNFRPFYYGEINWLDIPKNSGFTTEEIKLNYDALIDYNSVFYKGELEFPTLPMSSTGKIHFEEVKVIFVALQIMAFITGFMGIVLAIWKIKKSEFKFLKLASVLSIILPLSTSILIAANWKYAFVMFHKIFFNNNYWIFNHTTDPVITILPESFFMHSAIFVVLLILFGAVIYYVLYKHLRNKALKNNCY